MSSSILVVEDDRDIQYLLKMALSQAGFSVECVRTMPEAIAQSQKKLPDAAIIDWMLPQGSGLQLLHHWRHSDYAANLPTLFLTAKQEEDDKLKAFEKGIDDYLTKPFSTKELIARLHALLRRSHPLNAIADSADQCRIGALHLDMAQHRLSYKGEEIIINPTEFRLFQFFMTHRERVYSRTQLLDSVWGINAELEERTVDVHIRRLRKALENHEIQGIIETVRSVGYRFNAEALV
ncbi:MAG: winged helix-turn-helix domain-containing protein [Pseudomonadota bacterium]